jgi:hypothetical protein
MSHQKRTLNDLSQLKSIAQKERNETIQELKILWGINEFKFIASVSKGYENVQFLRNVRNLIGDQLRFPDGKRVSIMVPKSTNLDGNSEYIIHAHLAPDSKRQLPSNKYLLFLDVKKNNPQKHSLPTKEYVNKIRKDFESSQGAAKDTILGSLRRLTAETNKKPETFIFELIQNADDYPNPNKPDVHVSFDITNNHLVLTHDGLPFQQKNVYAICTVDAGDKKDDLNKTGFKGIGFKSIFKFSDHVWINSGGYSFRFDKNYFQKQGKEMPWQVIPIWTEPKMLEPEIKSLLNEPVSIFIRPTEGFVKLREISDIFNSIFKNDDRVLLFLRHVKSISFKDGKNQFKVEKDHEKWTISNLDSVIIPEDVKKKLELDASKDDRVPEKYKSINKSNLTFATSIDNGKVIKTKDTRLYAYLPTDWDFGFDFLINGDFIPDGSRDRLFDDIEWNLFLFKKAGFKFLEWIKELSGKFENNTPYSILPNLGRLIENEHDRAKKVFLEEFKQGFDYGVENVDFLKSIKGDHKLLNDLVIDKTGVAKILPEEIIKELISLSKDLLSPELASSSKVKALYNVYGEYNQFDWVNLERKIFLLNDWLKVPENNLVFLNFIIKKEQVGLFKDKEIILDQNGDLKCYSEVYDQIPAQDLEILNFTDFSYLNSNVLNELSNIAEIPLKVYTPGEFLENNILNKKSQIDENISSFQTSANFYNYLAQIYESVTSEKLKEIGWFSFFDRNKEICNQIDKENIYLEDDDINKLLDHKCVTSIKRLPQEYFQREGAILLWQKLGAKQILSTGIATFIKEEICDNIVNVNSNYVELYENNKDDYHLATKTLIKFLEENIGVLSDNETATLKKLNLFLGLDNFLSSPSAMSLYLENKELRGLIENMSFPREHFYILPEAYITTEASNELWKKLGVLIFEDTTAPSFIEKEICNSVDDLNIHFRKLKDDNSSSYSGAIKEIIKFIEKHIENLSETNLKQLAKLHVFLGEGNMLASVKDMSIYFDNENLSVLLKNKCLSDEQFFILPKSFNYTVSSFNFWKKIGVKDLNESNVSGFINEEICLKVNEINSYLKDLVKTNRDEYKKAIYSLVQFLQQNQNVLSEAHFKFLKKLNLFLDQETMSDSTVEMRLYFTEKSLTILVSNNCFPLRHFNVLPEDLLIDDTFNDFWIKMGVLEFDDAHLSNFIEDNILNKITEINNHYKVLFDTSEAEFLLASRGLLEFYSDSKVYLSKAVIDNLNEQLKGILALNSEGQLTPINENYIPRHYTGKNDIEKLLSSFPDVKISFLSSSYSEGSKLSIKDWKNIFVDLKAKNDNLEFIKKSLIPDIQDISQDTIVAATKLLFEYRDHLKEEIQNVESFPILKKDGDIIKSTEVTIGSHYLDESPTKSFIAHFNLLHEISPTYSSEKLDEWTKFFISLKVPTKTEDELIEEAIEVLLESQEVYILESSHKKIFTLLWQIHHSEHLSDNHYDLLKRWELKCYSNKSSEIRFEPAQSILFSNKYNPKIKFEDYEIEDEANFLSDFYLINGESQKDDFSFLKKLGVRGSFVYNRVNEISRDKMPVKYVEWIDKTYSGISSEVSSYKDIHKVSSWIEVPSINLIVNQEINAIFWEQVQEKKNFKDALFDTVTYKKQRSTESIDSEPFWFIKNNKTVLNLKGELCMPNDLYVFSLKDEINDDSLVASINFESIESEKFNNLADALKIKTSLDFSACIKILQRKESHNWLSKRHIISKIEDLINDGLTVEESERLEEFNKSGYLLSQTLEWLTIEKLYVVDSSFKLGITKSTNLLQHDFIGLVNPFKVKVLKEKDFEFDPLNKVKDNNLISLLLDRAKYLAFLQEEENWRDKEEELLEEVKKLSFYRCKKISWSYNESDPVISNSDFDFYYSDSTDEFFFIGKWDRIQAAEMYPILYKRLNLKDPVNEKVFKEILLAENIYELLNIFVENNYVLPLELDPDGKTLPKEETEEVQFESDDQSEIDIESNQVEDISTIINNKQESSPTEQPKLNEKKEGEIKDTNPVSSDNNKVSEEIYYSEEENSKLIKLFGNEIPKGFHKNLNLAALIKALVFLTKAGYETEAAEENLVKSHSYAQLSPVYLDGKEFTIMARSAKSGLLHIQVNAWERLEQAGVKLFVATGNNENDNYLFESKEEILKISNTKYQVFRVESESNVIATTAVLDGTFEKDKIWLLLKMKDSDEFDSIFTRIRDQELSPGEINEDKEGHY